MARPARPPEEAQAVREAAAIVRQETGLTAVSAISREIARRVTANLTTFIEQDTDEPMAAALERVRLSLNPCPFHFLATDPQVDTLELFLSFRAEAMRGRSGRYMNSSDAGKELAEISSETETRLAGRYTRHLS